MLTYATRRNRYIAALWPVLCNGIIVGVVLALTAKLPMLLTMAQVALGEVAVVYTVGLIMLSALNKLPARYLGLEAR